MYLKCKSKSCFMTSILTSLSEYKDLATMSNSMRVSAWNSLFSVGPFTVSFPDLESFTGVAFTVSDSTSSGVAL